MGDPNVIPGLPEGQDPESRGKWNEFSLEIPGSMLRIAPE